ncbi:uncharacterized protein MONBRDRAFT_13035 [Monosiga brevicollis MX1]|uniref:Uncharacterized protein n=1 Tax=Monosiga brevicollis TaxID=81824 RepID=A9VE27_MONBE|nr:uncharacterized protein MONBRDRAFT_13035 [Monosiga brevicollis MX1]EDQ84190.1 predicted protein [Monosiga brevicollis MX1]|eukprot:XP_001750978.1 hypothetical protein [Monosiga brevicollis MX1]
MGLLSTMVLILIKGLLLLALLEPWAKDKTYRFRSGDTFSLQLLMLTLLLSASLVGYVMLWFEPSPDCTPFRGTSSPWDVMEEWIHGGPSWLVTFVNFLTQPAFLVPLLIVMGYVPVHLGCLGLTCGLDATVSLVRDAKLSKFQLISTQPRCVCRFASFHYHSAVRYHTGTVLYMDEVLKNDQDSRKRLIKNWMKTMHHMAVVNGRKVGPNRNSQRNSQRHR